MTPASQCRPPDIDEADADVMDAQELLKRPSAAVTADKPKKKRLRLTGNQRRARRLQAAEEAEIAARVDAREEGCGAW